MRLNEFTDPADYTLTDTDATGVLEQIGEIRPARIRDDGVPYQSRPKKHPQNDRAKLSDDR